MKASVYSIEGKKGKEIELPKVFSEKIDFDLVKRAVLSTESKMIQPNGPSRRGGRENTAVYIGARGKPQGFRIMNTEHARLPHLKNRRMLLSGRVAGVPHAVSGPRAHKLSPDKIVAEKINKKERKKALLSAIAATGNSELAKRKGHVFDEKMSFPIVIETAFENLQKTKEVKKVLEAMNLFADVESAKSKRKIRAGKGTKRGRKYKKKKSLLIVAGNTEKIFRAARNLEGVEIVSAKDLSVKLLAPGSVPGRLTLWTENALNAIKAM